MKFSTELWRKGEINKKDFVINITRSFSFGIKFTQERGRRIFEIPVNRIKDTETFGFLKQAESRWDNELPLLEFALDGEDSLIFS